VSGLRAAVGWCSCQVGWQVRTSFITLALCATHTLLRSRIVSLCKPCALGAESNVAALTQIGRTFGEPLATVVLRESRTSARTAVPLCIGTGALRS
jgi:hypothetical protein